MARDEALYLVSGLFYAGTFGLLFTVWIGGIGYALSFTAVALSVVIMLGLAALGRLSLAQPALIIFPLCVLGAAMVVRMILGGSPFPFAA